MRFEPKVNARAVLYPCAVAILFCPVTMTAGNLFATSVRNGDVGITEITPAGVESAFASGLSSPQGLAFDSSGNLYEADFGSGKIFRFDPTGNRSTFATGLSNPTGLAINSAGNLFEADRTSGAIYEFTPAGSKSAFASGLSAPDGLAFDRVGNLFVSNVGDNTITEIAPNGAKTTFASGLNYPTGLAFDSAGNLFEADTGSSLIYKFTPAGARSLFVHGGADGIAIDRTDVLFAAGSTGGLLEIQPDGTETEFASDISSAAFVALQPTPVPEPATYSVVGGLALLGFAAWSRRQR